MGRFFEIACLSQDEQEQINDQIERQIQEKKKLGLLSDREIQEIETMRLRPLPDIQDVQSVYEDHLFKS
ncbi:MAG: hypothetical protein N3B16_04285 [Candidatus Aminicenantes bacterium]|nr:hypothetical protein [Candidatus Aminicenantes bacterium]